jgi:hypothetical protein
MIVTIRSSSSVVSSPALEYQDPLRKSLSVIPLVEVHISLLDDNVGVSSADTLDSGQSKHDLFLSINVGVEKTQDVLKSILIGNHKSHGCRVMSNVLTVELVVMGESLE